MAELNRRPLIRLSKSSVGDAEKQAVEGVLAREYLGMGAEVQQFEQVLSGYFGRPAVCVVNGTAALHLALQACGIGDGDEVLVQSLTYVASFQAIAATGAKPVACDVVPETLTLDWRDAERRITPRTKAVMPVHYGGAVGELDEIYVFARKHGLRVIEDAAHAFGSLDRGRRVGGFGDVACFSFDGIKNVTSGEGGCIVTDDPSVLRKAQDARLLGVERDTEKRYLGNRSWSFDVTEQGWRYHMSNIMAAIGLAQFDRLPEIARRRRQLAASYVELLRGQHGIALLDCDYGEVVPHIFAIRLRGLADRPALLSALEGRGIQCGYHYQPNHCLTYFREEGRAPLPVTEEVFPELLTLPLHMDLADSDVEYVAETVIAIAPSFCRPRSSES